MGNAIDHVQHEFWRPPVQAASEAVTSHDLSETCPHCSSEFIVGARFCHSCGTHRPSLSQSSAILRVPGLSEFVNIGERVGLTLFPFIAFVVGTTCLVAALTVGIVFGAKTLLDWQAIQLWRIELLLGSIAAFVAGILLRKSKLY